MWQKLDRFLGQKCCVFCGRSPSDANPAVHVELVPPDGQKPTVNGVLPPANGHVSNGSAGGAPLGPGNIVFQETRVQLSGAPAAAAGIRGGQPGGQAGPGGAPTAAPPLQSALLQREAPRQPHPGWPGAGADPTSGHPAVSWADSRPQPGSGHAGGPPPAASLRNPYQPSPNRHVPPSAGGQQNGQQNGQQGSAGFSKTDGAAPGAGQGPGRANLQWGAQVPPPAYSLPRQQQQQQQRPAEEVTLPATLPAGVGHDRPRPGDPQPPTNGLANGEPGFISDLKAGDLLGRSNEELVLLLIQLRRQAAAAAAARDRVSRQLDRAVAEAGGGGRQTEVTERLRGQMARLDTQHQLTRPLITLVDNMLKLSALRGSRGGPGGGGGQPLPGDPSDPLPSSAPLAPPSGQTGDAQDRPSGPGGGEDGPVRDSERLLQRQRALQDELSRVKAVLSSSAKTLDETAADNSRLEREMLSLRQRLQTALKATNHNSSYSSEVRALEAEVRRVQRMLSSRQAGRGGAGPEDSRRGGSVRRPQDDHRQGDPAPLHRAGSARLPTAYDAQYDEQSLLNRHEPPPPAPPAGQYHQSADRRHPMANGISRHGPGGPAASPPDSSRQQRPGDRRGLPKSVSGPLGGDYDSLYDTPYDAAAGYGRTGGGYDPPPYVAPAPPPAGVEQWRGADWPGRAGGAAWPPGRPDWHRDTRGGSARYRAGSQQDVRSALTDSQNDVRSALTASQQDVRSGLTASQQDVRTALAASYQAYRRASGALGDGDGERRLQAVLRQYRSQQDLGATDSGVRYGGYRHMRGASYGQEGGTYYQGGGGRMGPAPQQHRRSYSQLYEPQEPAHERRRSVHQFGEPGERGRSLPRAHDPRERDRSLPRNGEIRDRDPSLPRNHDYREQDRSLPRNYEPHSLPRAYDNGEYQQSQARPQEPAHQPNRPHEPQYQPTRPHEPTYQSTRPHEPPYQPGRPHEHPCQPNRPHEPYQSARPHEPAYQSARPQEQQPHQFPRSQEPQPSGEAVVKQPSPLRARSDPAARPPPPELDDGGLLHRPGGGAFQPYQADHAAGPGRDSSGQEGWREAGAGGEPVYAAVRKHQTNGGAENARGETREPVARQDWTQQQQQQQYEQQQQQQRQQQQQQQYDQQRQPQPQQQRQQQQQYEQQKYDQQQQQLLQQHQQQQQYEQQQRQRQQQQHEQQQRQQQQQQYEEQQRLQYEQQYKQQQQQHHHQQQQQHQQQRQTQQYQNNQHQQQQQQQHPHLTANGYPVYPSNGDASSGRPRSPVPPENRQAAEDHWRDQRPAAQGGPHGNGTIPGLHVQSPPHQTSQQTVASHVRSPTSGGPQIMPSGVAEPANQRSPQQQPAQQPGQQQPQLSPQQSAEEVAEAGSVRPPPTGAEAGPTSDGRSPQEEQKTDATPGTPGTPGVDSSSTGTVGQRVSMWETKGPKPAAPPAAGTQQRQQTDGRQEPPSGDQADSQQTQEAMGPLYALLARDRGSLEIKTVRTVKRESQQRNRDKSRQASLEDVPAAGSDDDDDDDPLVTDPVLSQFQRAMSLPRGYGGRRSSDQATGSQHRHQMLKRLVDKHGASAEELTGEPRTPLRQASSTPDIVRASRPGLATKYDEETIDKLLARPQKIRIPERYVPELEVEPMSVEERLQRSRKAASIRKMLTQSTGFLDTIGSQTAEPRARPGAAATDKLQRAHILQLNEILARQVTEQSKRVAVEAIANMEAPVPEGPAESPPPEPLPLVQQRESCLS